MKITKRQLRRIIRESRADDEADRGWRDFHNGLERDISGSHWYQTGYDEAKENAANRRDTPPVMRETSKFAREENARLMKEMHPRAEADNQYVEVLEAAEELIRSRNVSIKPGLEEDEVYIMTGAAEGITVKILRRGR